MQHAVVLVTAGSREEARSIASALVADGLAACVQMLPVESHYVWDGNAVDADEILLLVKTRADAFERLSARVRALHSYDVPEIVMLDISAGLPAYLDWIDEVVRARPRSD